ncbi:hypothetical protein [Telluribacter sp. SYSU D00476]|uniref:hypothetical protein n=1 Tax=Telluribacter sp. SYSU D00476 TaxID=2811430 RepID=UPI001FF2FDD2|nr:hypothetical protein [Telluribacter sp. SYSU D00476]
MTFKEFYQLAHFDYLYLYIERFTQSRFWQVKLSLVLFGFVFLTTYPNYLDILADPAPRTTFDYFYQKVESPLSPAVVGHTGSHGAKIAFRLTIPLLAKVLRIGWTVTGKDVVLVFLLQSLLLFPFLLLLTRIVNRHLDAVSTVLFTVACSATYLASAFFWDYHFWFDAYAFFFLLMGMYLRNRIGIFIFLLMACFTDERAVIALLSVYLFHLLEESNFTISGFRDLFPRSSIRSRSSIVLLVVVSYVLIRLWLTTAYNLRTPSGENVGVSLSIIPFQLKHRLIGILFTFEGLWIPFLLSIIVLILRKQKLLAGILLATLLLHIVVAYSVYDITRSLTYGFPIFFIALLIAGKSFERDRRHILLIVLLCCLVVPTHYVIYNIIQIPWTITAYDELKLVMKSL